MEEEVSPLIVAKHYLTVELGKPFQKQESKLKLKEFVNSLENEELWALLKLISEEYRKNGVFQLLFNSPNWNKDTIKIKDIKLGEVNDKVKPYLITADYDPLRFKELLMDNLEVEELKEFKPKNVQEEESVFIFTYIDGKYKIIDGIHRFMSLVQQGLNEVKGFIKVL